MNYDDKEKNKLQVAILMIAKDISALCDKYEIPYFIMGGTQLGAVRHKGFIPWDDDFDIGMRRCDYNEFIQKCQKELDQKKYYIQTEDSEENYAFSFAKIQLKNTVVIEEFSENVSIHHGIFVDVFPYDNLPDGKIGRKFFLLENYVLKNLLWIKCGYGTKSHKSKVLYKILRKLTSLISIDTLKKMRKKVLFKYNNIETKQKVTSDYPNEQLISQWFEDLIPYRFEDTEFLGLANYYAYLK